MEKRLKVKGYDSLYRDVSTGAIINNSKAEYDQYKKQKEAVQNRKQEFKQYAEEINKMKNDIQEIKSLLQKILEK